MKKYYILMLVLCCVFGWGSYTHWDMVSGINGLGVGAKGSEISVASSTGQLYQVGTLITATGAEINTIADGVTTTATEVNILDLSVAGAVTKYIAYDLTFSATDVEIDIAEDLPFPCLVTKVFFNCTVAEATGGTKTIDIGILSTEGSGDANGFCAAIPVSATGIVMPGATITAGTGESFFASTTKGVLLASLTAGTNLATDVGTYYEFPHVVVLGSQSITYTMGSGDFESLVGVIIVEYIQLN